MGGARRTRRRGSPWQRRQLAGLVCALLWPASLGLLATGAPYDCPTGSDYTGQALGKQPWLHVQDATTQPAASPPPTTQRKFASQLDGRRQCPPGLGSPDRSGSWVTPLGQQYYELRDLCIRPMFLGGVTLYRPRDGEGRRLKLKDEGLEVCTEFRCAPYPVSVSKKAFPCSKAKWVTGASALIVPFTNGNPWHFLHHLLPLAHVLEKHQASLRNSTVHMYTTLAARPNSAPVSPHRGRARRWHPFPARTYFSPWRFRWWPLLGAAPPAGTDLLQVDHLELLRDDPEFSDPAASATVCYEHAILGLPLLFDHETAQHPQPLVPLQHIRAFRNRALGLLGSATTGGRDSSVAGAASLWAQPSRCRHYGQHLQRTSDSPILGLVVRKGTRKMCNLKDVAEAAAGLGFHVELLSFEEMDVFAQIEATSQLDVFVGVHGAGMTNVFWLDEGTTALELYPALPKEPLVEGTDVNRGSNYGRLAAIAGAQHTVWLQKSISGGGSTSNQLNVSDVPFRLLDLTMDVTALKGYLGDVLKYRQHVVCE